MTKSFSIVHRTSRGIFNIHMVHGARERLYPIPLSNSVTLTMLFNLTCEKYTDEEKSGLPQCKHANARPKIKLQSVVFSFDILHDDLTAVDHVRLPLARVELSLHAAG